MQLLRLTYKNFKAQSQNIVLNGTNLDVFGANGAGKTTVADAFIWLLFGKDSKNSDLSEDIKVKSGVDNGLEHEVEAVLELDDGGHITLKRVFHEIWTKKRGEATASFSGHTTDFYINDVPVKKKQYTEQINSIVAEDKFRLLTDPLYFKDEVSWQDRRAILLEVCGNVSDETVFAANKELAALPALLDGRTIDDYRKMLQSQRSKVNEELKKLPVRIDEAQRNLPDVVGMMPEVIQTELNDLKRQQLEIQHKIMTINDGGGAADKQKQIAELEGKQIAVKNKYDRELNQQALANQSIIGELQSKKERARRSIADEQHRMEMLEKVITAAGEHIQKLRDDWNIENERAFAAEIDDVCPTCGQRLPADRVEAARQRALEAFNLEKSEKLTSITNEGKKATEKLAADGEQLEHMQADVAGMEAKIAAVDDEIASRQAAAENVLDYQQDEEYQTAVAQITALKAEIDDLKAGSRQEVVQLQADIRALDTDIAARQEKLALIKTRKDSEARIVQLQAQQKTLVAEFEQLERNLYLTELFIKTKVSMLDKKINSKFHIAQFRLFSEQVNGGLSECCDILYDGVAKMSNSEEIKVGLDIIRTLSEHYGIRTPIFVDNCESITELPQMDAQVIRLVVSAEDKELRIVRKDKEQAAA